MHKGIPMTKEALKVLDDTTLSPESILIGVGEKTVGSEKYMRFTFAVPVRGGYTVTDVYR